MKIYEEFGFAWNLRRIITPDFTYDQLLDLSHHFIDELKEEVVVTCMCEYNMLFFTKAVTEHIKESFIEAGDIRMDYIKKKTEYSPQWVKYTLENGVRIKITTAPDDYILPEEKNECDCTLVPYKNLTFKCKKCEKIYTSI